MEGLPKESSFRIKSWKVKPKKDVFLNISISSNWDQGGFIMGIFFYRKGK